MEDSSGDSDQEPLLHVQPTTEVFIGFKRLENPLAAATGQLLETAGSSVGGQRAGSHWAVVLLYLDQPMRHVIEAGRDATGQLRPAAYWQTEEGLLEAGYELRSLGLHHVTQELVHQAVLETSDLGRYNLVSQNCQHYVRIFLFHLAVDMPGDLHTADATLFRCAVCAATAGAIGGSVTAHVA